MNAILAITSIISIALAVWCFHNYMTLFNTIVCSICFVAIIIDQIWMWGRHYTVVISFIIMSILFPTATICGFWLGTYNEITYGAWLTGFTLGIVFMFWNTLEHKKNITA